MTKTLWLHKWLSPLVGIQLLIWLGTGLFFNIVGHDWGSGSDFRQAPQHTLPCNTPPVPLQELALPFKAAKIELRNLAGNCFYLAYRTRQFHHYLPFDGQRFDAATGLQSDFITEEAAQGSAVASYSGSGVMISSVFFEAGESPDHKQKNPLWQFVFDDDLATKVYVHGITGEVTHHDNARSEIRKLMLKLHFMDYFNTGRFNTSLLIAFALMSLILTITGIIWLFKKSFRAARTPC